MTEPNLCQYGLTKDNGVECPYGRQNTPYCTNPDNESGLCDLNEPPCIGRDSRTMLRDLEKTDFSENKKAVFREIITETE